MNPYFDNLSQQVDHAAAPKVVTPAVGSFREFLEKHARVKTPDGSYVPYTFDGREALEFVVGIIDTVMGNSALHSPDLIGVKSAATTASAATAEDGGLPQRTEAASENRVRPPLQPISDARLTATGSAQWGKTILELNFLAYAAGLQFRSVGLFLPDEDLVEGIVDSKLRPDVLDQQPWLNSLITLGCIRLRALFLEVVKPL